MENKKQAPLKKEMVEKKNIGLLLLFSWSNSKDDLNWALKWAAQLINPIVVNSD